MKSQFLHGEKCTSYRYGSRLPIPLHSAERATKIEGQKLNERTRVYMCHRCTKGSSGYQLLCHFLCGNYQCHVIQIIIGIKMHRQTDYDENTKVNVFLSKRHTYGIQTASLEQLVDTLAQTGQGTTTSVHDVCRKHSAQDHSHKYQDQGGDTKTLNIYTLLTHSFSYIK